MATFKPTIFKDRQRLDKTWNIFIRFTHNRKIRYIPTTMYVTKKDITASFKIKNAAVIDRCNDLIKNYRERINELSLEFNEVDIDTIISYITQKRDKKGISFSHFAHSWIEQNKGKGGIKNYTTALNAFCLFMGRENILCEDINVRTMKAFEESLKDRPRAQSLYPNNIKKMFNDAREFYNDEENNIIRIKHSLNKYKVVEQNIAKKRALDIETIRKIFALPYDNIKVKGMISRHDLSLDCFKLSFCLMGMNSADLFTASEFDGKTITYNRQKTKNRRRDMAEMQVDVHSCIADLVKKYQGKERVFNFYERFRKMEDLNRSINIGLKEVGHEVGVERLQFYAARHSLATIACNDVGISKYIVNDMLCHTDQALKITEMYIKKDFSQINEANSKILEYIFKTNNQVSNQITTKSATK